MSAGASSIYPGEQAIYVQSDLCFLAPKMRAAVKATLAECRDVRGLDAVVFESYRERATAITYFNRGRIIEAEGIVTNAPDETWSWHGYGLAVDIISATKGWKVGETWHRMVAAVASTHGLKSGIDWKRPDLPHHQWGRCRATPSGDARRILKEQGLPAVWRAVSAA